ncbi:unnamed protein product [Adineta ricciae]|uniref:F-box domain-containing protein n=1 Tax=Adineta ricciae TaxID=249248 RepID=A0A816AH08_ADIRI|nr:unnamed protein product [Adineta ricciae]
MHTFSTLPVELVYRIMDHQNELTLFCSMHNICRRLNKILSTYERYRDPVKFSIGSDRIRWDPVGSEHGFVRPGYITFLQTLTTLHLSGTGIGDEGAQRIADALQTNTALTTLDLSWNEIRDEGAQQIADALRTNTTLTTLNLSRNAISDIGAQCIADALQRNTALTTLDLSWNKIRVEGAQDIADALQTNTALTTLNLDENRIGHEGAEDIAEV